MTKYVEYLEEVFSEFGPIQPRRMFGGYGLFLLNFLSFPDRRLPFGSMGGCSHQVAGLV